MKVVKKLDKKHLDLICSAIKSGELVVIPTETVYGLAADALNPDAVKKIFEVKGRPADNPLIVHIAETKTIEKFVSEVPEMALKLAKKFWPGPLTMILKKSEIVPSVVTGGLNTVALRMPSHPVALEILRAVEHTGLAAPSANISGKPSPTSVLHCEKDLGNKVDFIIDGGECDFGMESTVISLVGENPIILRPGVITREDIQKVLKQEVLISENILEKPDIHKQVLSPGVKYKHYAPDADVVLINSNLRDFAEYVNNIKERDCAVLVFDGEEKYINKFCFTYGAQKDFLAQSKNLFKVLRSIDETDFKKVYVRSPEPTGIGLAIYNRLVRAANFNVINLDNQSNYI